MHSDMYVGKEFAALLLGETGRGEKLGVGVDRGQVVPADRETRSLPSAL